MTASPGLWNFLGFTSPPFLFIDSSIDSSQFSNNPTRSNHVKLLTKGKNCFSAHNAADTKRECFPHRAILTVSEDANSVSHNLIPSDTNYRVPWDHLSFRGRPGWVISYKGSWNSGKHLIDHHGFTMKDADGHPGEGVHRAIIRKHIEKTSEEKKSKRFPKEQCGPGHFCSCEPASIHEV